MSYYKGSFRAAVSVNCFMMFTLPLVVHWHLTFCPFPLWMLFLSLAGKTVMGPWRFPKTTTTGGMFIPPLPHTRMKFPEIPNHNTQMKKSERTGSRLRHNTHLYYSKSFLFASVNGSKVLVRTPKERNIWQFMSDKND